MLAMHGANLDAEDDAGMTALESARSRSARFPISNEIVETLLALGATE